MKNKRGTNHDWTLVKYSGDSAIYAECSCGYHYNCSRSIREPDGSWSMKQYPTIFYPYCPCCGARKNKYIKDIEKRSMYDLLNRKKFGTIYDISGYFVEV